MRFDNTRWLSPEFISSVVDASGMVYDQPSAFGDASFLPNQQMTFEVFINVPVNTNITAINVSDGTGNMATIQIR